MLGVWENSFLYLMLFLDYDECKNLCGNVCLVKIKCENLDGDYICLCVLGYELKDSGKIKG